MNPLTLSCFDCLKLGRKNKSKNHSKLTGHQITFLKRTLLHEPESVSFRANLKFKTSTNQLWIFKNLDLQSMEVMHGLHCIANIVPDKLDTAIAINRENLNSCKDDGSFLITLIQNLIADYTDIHNKHSSKQPRTYTELPILYSQTFNSEICIDLHEVYFPEILSNFTDLFSVFKTILPSRNTILLTQLSSFIKEYTKNIDDTYLIYDKEIRPKLLASKRQQVSIKENLI